MSDIRNDIKDTVKNVRDGVDEHVHRTEADAEKLRRETEGDTMTTGEKVSSVGNEAKNRAEAEVDHVKRELRGDPTT